MKRFLILVLGSFANSLCVGLDPCRITFVNDSKSAYTIDASELKDAVLSYDYFMTRSGKYKSVIEQVQICPGRYLLTYLHNDDTHIDHGRITIKRDNDIVSVLNITVPEHFESWQLIPDNIGWWCRFSVNESMNTVIEKQVRGHGFHFIRIHDRNPDYRYSNQPESNVVVRIMHEDGSEYPEPPANGDLRPQIIAAPMNYDSVPEDYLNEYEKKSEKDGSCCLLL